MSFAILTISMTDSCSVKVTVGEINLIHNHMFSFVTGSQCQEKMEATIEKLKGQVQGCSERETVILASAVEEIHQTKNVDAFKELMVIQVVSNLVSLKYSVFTMLRVN